MWCTFFISKDLTGPRIQTGDTRAANGLGLKYAAYRHGTLGKPLGAHEKHDFEVNQYTVLGDWTPKRPGY